MVKWLIGLFLLDRYIDYKIDEAEEEYEEEGDEEEWLEENVSVGEERVGCFLLLLLALIGAIYVSHQ